jgi:hypothetical protein
MGEITAVVHGETDIIVISWNTEDLNKINSPLAIAIIRGCGNSTERILDFNEGKNLTVAERNGLRDKNFALRSLIAGYISTQPSYTLLETQGPKTIVLTSLRSTKGYVTRIAGILPYRYFKVHCILDGDPIPAYDGLLLRALSACPPYPEQYEANSIFHKLKSEASTKGPRIEINESW